MFWEFHDVAVKHCHKIPSSHHNLLDHPPPPNTGIITPSYFPRLVGGTPWWRNTWMIPKQMSEDWCQLGMLPRNRILAKVLSKIVIILKIHTWHIYSCEQHEIWPQHQTAHCSSGWVAQCPGSCSSASTSGSSCFPGYCQLCILITFWSLTIMKQGYIYMESTNDMKWFINWAPTPLRLHQKRYPSWTCPPGIHRAGKLSSSVPCHTGCWCWSPHHLRPHQSRADPAPGSRKESL